MLYPITLDPKSHNLLGGAQLLLVWATGDYGWSNSTRNMEGVNHCRSHCRLAKFRGLMNRGKCSAVIGRKCILFYVPSMNF